jgi:hypothetical protein
MGLSSAKELTPPIVGEKQNCGKTFAEARVASGPEIGIDGCCQMALRAMTTIS